MYALLQKQSRAAAETASQGLVSVRGLQPKLAVNVPGDAHEQEADRVAEQVMRMPEPQGATAGISGRAAGVQRECACGATCDDCQKKHHDEQHPRVQMKAAGPVNTGGVEAPPIVHDVLRSSGQPLDAATRAFMEPRFGHDFSKVRVHTDVKAAASSTAIQASAYTSGHDIVFNRAQYQPHSDRGRRLLAHELTHVLQQRNAPQRNRIARFSDDTHNIIDEVASTLAGMDAKDIEQVHKGNTSRDYSQSPAVANLLLLCEESTFGGYKDYEHFDNFRWNDELQKFQSRDNPDDFGKKSPITYISEELMNFVDGLPDRTAFRHVGNAFHTVEDFFAHSNFVELTHGDYQHGDKLITGSVGGTDSTSTLKILESVSSLETAPFYGEQANKEIAAAPPQSHARMAKDYKSNPYHLEAIVLAGLVIKELGAHILALKKLGSKAEQSKFVREVIMEKVKRYLRPPDQRDKWWEDLRASGGREMEDAIKTARAKTPVTTNQCFLSPLRSIEASRDSSMKLIGPAFAVPTKMGHVWVQVGTGFAATPAFNTPSGDPAPRSTEFVPVGVQITGRFDLGGGRR